MGTAFWAHVGGFVAGITLVKIFCGSGRVVDHRKRRGQTDRMVSRYSRN